MRKLLKTETVGLGDKTDRCGMRANRRPKEVFTLSDQEAPHWHLCEEEGNRRAV